MYDFYTTTNNSHILSKNYHFLFKVSSLTIQLPTSLTHLSQINILIRGPSYFCYSEYIFILNIGFAYLSNIDNQTKHCLGSIGTSCFNTAFSL